MMNILGKTALVTGASRGIGRAIALEFAQQGIERLLLVARNRQQLEALAVEIEAIGVEAIVLPLDLTDLEEVTVAIAQAWRDFGPIHLLVNCAGVAHQAPFLRANLSNVQSEINTNLMGMYGITRQVARRMVARQEGTIVNVASLMGKIAAPTMATYSATKFAILGFTQALRGELAQHQVKVVALLPSLTETDMVQDFQPFRWMVKMSPQQVAKVLIHGLKRDTPEIAVGWQSHLAIAANRLAPRLVERFVQLAAPGAGIFPRFQHWLAGISRIRLTFPKLKNQPQLPSALALWRKPVMLRWRLRHQPVVKWLVKY
jgi:3-oxoacyl-[acyl-carrier protein] reductase